MESSPDKPQVRGKDDPRAIAWKKRYDFLKDERSTWDTYWQDIADYFLPRKSGITSTAYSPDPAKYAQIFDTTGQDSAIQCAAGLLSWTTPANEPWFGWEPVRELRGSDATKQWLQECSELAREYLANSNFYTERHEDLLNHCTFGTSALYVQLLPAGQYSGIRTHFDSLSIGSYVIAEDCNGRVDTLYREIELTASQAQEKWGKDRLGKELPMPEIIAKCLQGDQKKPDQKFKFLHVVEPRKERDQNSPALRDKAWTDTYIEMESKTIMADDGFDSFPFMVGRWLKTNWGGPSVWGEGPGFTALPEARQLNFLQKMMDVNAEKIVNPPIMIPDSFEGVLSQSAGAQNIYAQGIEANAVYPLQMQGDFKVGLERVEMRRKAIETKFHVDFFQMFRNTDPRITATQVNEMAGERLTMISPAFARLVSEKDSPMLTRLFELWASNGMLPPPPEEAIQATTQGIYTPNPTPVYTSRLALAVKALRNISFDRSFARIMAIAGVDPSVLDNINMPIMTRDSMRNDGVPADWVRPMEEVQAMQAARAQQAAQMQQMEMLKQAGSGAKDLATAASTDAGKKMMEAA